MPTVLGAVQPSTALLDELVDEFVVVGAGRDAVALSVRSLCGALLMCCRSDGEEATTLRMD
jgi:hypothetical protein